MEKNINNVVLEVLEDLMENIISSPLSDYTECSPRSPSFLAQKRKQPIVTLKVPKYNPTKDDIPSEENIKFKYNPVEGLIFSEITIKKKKKYDSKFSRNI